MENAKYYGKPERPVQALKQYKRSTQTHVYIFTDVNTHVNTVRVKQILQRKTKFISLVHLVCNRKYTDALCAVNVD